jgi:hypothetical protein
MSKLAQAVILLIRTRKASGSNLGRDTKYAEVFRGFAEPFQENAGLAPDVIPLDKKNYPEDNF